MSGHRVCASGCISAARGPRFNCSSRIGSSQIEIKNHVFFSPINWDDLNAKKITPPFNPNVVRSFSHSPITADADGFLILYTLVT